MEVRILSYCHPRECGDPSSAFKILFRYLNSGLGSPGVPTSIFLLKNLLGTTRAVALRSCSRVPSRLHEDDRNRSLVFCSCNSLYLFVYWCRVLYFINFITFNFITTYLALPHNDLSKTWRFHYMAPPKSVMHILHLVAQQ